MFTNQKLSTLVVDDDPDIVDFMTHVLQAANCEVHSAGDGEQALQEAMACKPQVVFLDVNIPDQDGWLVCSKLKMPLKGPRIVLITGRTESDTDRFAAFVHADEILHKPFSEEDVLRAMSNACHVA